MVAKIVFALAAVIVMVQSSLVYPSTYYGGYYGYPGGNPVEGSFQRASAVATPVYANADASSDNYYPGGYNPFPIYEKGYPVGRYPSYPTYPWRPTYPVSPVYKY